LLPNNCPIAINFPSQTSSATGVIWSQKIVRASFQVVVGSGSLTGTFNLQASNDFAEGNGAFPNQFIPTNWSTVGTTSVICSSTGANATFLLSSTEMSYEYLRLQYVAGNSGNTPGLYTVRIKSQGL